MGFDLGGGEGGHAGRNVGRGFPACQLGAIEGGVRPRPTPTTSGVGLLPRTSVALTENKHSTRVPPPSSTVAIITVGLGLVKTFTWTREVAGWRLGRTGARTNRGSGALQPS